MNKYTVPEIEILTVATEQGFATSFQVNGDKSTDQMLLPGLGL